MKIICRRRYSSHLVDFRLCEFKAKAPKEQRERVIFKADKLSLLQNGGSPENLRVCVGGGGGRGERRSAMEEARCLKRHDDLLLCATF